MINPSKSDIGRRVVYRPFWPDDATGRPLEAGVITGLAELSETWVLVRYDGDADPRATAVYTATRDLEWETP